MSRRRTRIASPTLGNIIGKSRRVSGDLEKVCLVGVSVLVFCVSQRHSDSVTEHCCLGMNVYGGLSLLCGDGLHTSDHSSPEMRFNGCLWSRILYSVKTDIVDQLQSNQCS